MFKKLFISLIILSTLTSEGVVNIPWNFYSFCFHVGKIEQAEFLFLSEVEPNRKSQDKNLISQVVDTAGLLPLSTQHYEKFTGSVLSVLKRGQPLFAAPVGDMNAEQQYAGTETGNYLGSDFSYQTLKTIVFKQSDASPPEYTL